MRRHFSGRSKPLLSVTPDHYPSPGGNHSESHTSPVGSKRWGLPDDVAGPHRYVRTKRPSQKCKRCVDVGVVLFNGGWSDLTIRAFGAHLGPIVEA